MDIVDEAIYAERLGYHSAWLGEHHFNSLGVMSCPDIALAYIAAKTERIRLAPAVTVLPLHHPIRVAEQWATLDLLSGGRVDFATGRGYDRGEYMPFGATFDDNAAAFAEGLDVLRRLWSGEGPRLASRQVLEFRRHRDHAAAGAAPDPDPRRLVLAPDRGACGQARLRPRHRSLCRHHHPGRRRRGRALYTRKRARGQGTKPGRIVSSYFIHFADTAGRGARGARAADPLCARMRRRGLAGRRATTVAQDLRLLSRLQGPHAAAPSPRISTTARSSSASPTRIIERLKVMEGLGFDEVILYFNVGLKPHAQVKEEMARFMEEVAPAFAATRVAAQ